MTYCSRPFLGGEERGRNKLARGIRNNRFFLMVALNWRDALRYSPRPEGCEGLIINFGIKLARINIENKSHPAFIDRNREDFKHSREFSGKP